MSSNFISSLSEGQTVVLFAVPSQCPYVVQQKLHLPVLVKADFPLTQVATCQQAHLEVHVAGEHFGFKSAAAGGRYLQVRKRGGVKLCFYSRLFGIWEHWKVSAVEAAAAPQYISSFPVLKLYPRQLPNFKLDVHVLRLATASVLRNAPTPLLLLGESLEDEVLSLSHQVVRGFVTRVATKYPLCMVFRMWRQAAVRLTADRMGGAVHHSSTILAALGGETPDKDSWCHMCSAAGSRAASASVSMGSTGYWLQRWRAGAHEVRRKRCCGLEESCRLGLLSLLVQSWYNLAALRRTRSQAVTTTLMLSERRIRCALAQAVFIAWHQVTATVAAAHHTASKYAAAHDARLAAACLREWASAAGHSTGLRLRVLQWMEGRAVSTQRHALLAWQAHKHWQARATWLTARMAHRHCSETLRRVLFAWRCYAIDACTSSDLGRQKDRAAAHDLDLDSGQAPFLSQQLLLMRAICAWRNGVWTVLRERNQAEDGLQKRHQKRVLQCCMEAWRRAVRGCGRVVPVLGRSVMWSVTAAHALRVWKAAVIQARSAGRLAEAANAHLKHQRLQRWWGRWWQQTQRSKRLQQVLAVQHGHGRSGLQRQVLLKWHSVAAAPCVARNCVKGTGTRMWSVLQDTWSAWRRQHVHQQQRTLHTAQQQQRLLYPAVCGWLHVAAVARQSRQAASELHLRRWHATLCRMLRHWQAWATRCALRRVLLEGAQQAMALRRVGACVAVWLALGLKGALRRRQAATWARKLAWKHALHSLRAWRQAAAAPPRLADVAAAWRSRRTRARVLLHWSCWAQQRQQRHSHMAAVLSGQLLHRRAAAPMDYWRHWARRAHMTATAGQAGAIHCCLLRWRTVAQTAQGARHSRRVSADVDGGHAADARAALLRSALCEWRGVVLLGRRRADCLLVALRAVHAKRVLRWWRWHVAAMHIPITWDVMHVPRVDGECAGVPAALVDDVVLGVDPQGQAVGSVGMPTTCDMVHESAAGQLCAQEARGAGGGHEAVEEGQQQQQPLGGVRGANSAANGVQHCACPNNGDHAAQELGVWGPHAAEAAMTGKYDGHGPTRAAVAPRPCPTAVVPAPQRHASAVFCTIPSTIQRDVLATAQAVPCVPLGAVAFNGIMPIRGACLPPGAAGAACNMVPVTPDTACSTYTASYELGAVVASIVAAPPATNTATPSATVQGGRTHSEPRESDELTAQQCQQPQFARTPGPSLCPSAVLPAVGQGSVLNGTDTVASLPVPALTGSPWRFDACPRQPRVSCSTQVQAAGSMGKASAVGARTITSAPLSCHSIVHVGVLATAEARVGPHSNWRQPVAVSSTADVPVTAQGYGEPLLGPASVLGRSAVVCHTAQNPGSSQSDRLDEVCGVRVAVCCGLSSALQAALDAWQSRRAAATADRTTHKPLDGSAFVVYRQRAPGPRSGAAVALRSPLPATQACSPLPATQACSHAVGCDAALPQVPLPIPSTRLAGLHVEGSKLLSCSMAMGITGNAEAMPNTLQCVAPSCSTALCLGPAGAEAAVAPLMEAAPANAIVHASGTWSSNPLPPQILSRRRGGCAGGVRMCQGQGAARGHVCATIGWQVLTTVCTCAKLAAAPLERAERSGNASSANLAQVNDRVNATLAPLQLSTARLLQSSIMPDCELCFNKHSRVPPSQPAGNDTGAQTGAVLPLTGGVCSCHCHGLQAQTGAVLPLTRGVCSCHCHGLQAQAQSAVVNVAEVGELHRLLHPFTAQAVMRANRKWTIVGFQGSSGRGSSQQRLLSAKPCGQVQAVGRSAMQTPPAQHGLDQAVQSRAALPLRVMQCYEEEPQGVAVARAFAPAACQELLQGSASCAQAGCWAGTGSSASTHNEHTGAGRDARFGLVHDAEEHLYISYKRLLWECAQLERALMQVLGDGGNAQFGDVGWNQSAPSSYVFDTGTMVDQVPQNQELARDHVKTRAWPDVAAGGCRGMYCEQLPVGTWNAPASTSMLVCNLSNGASAAAAKQAAVAMLLHNDMLREEMDSVKEAG